MTDCIVNLINEDDNGEETSREVFATIENVTQKEFFSAAQAGFRSEFKITMWGSDYKNEEAVILTEQPLRYSVYRKYLRNDGKIELYLTDRVVDYG